MSLLDIGVVIDEKSWNSPNHTPSALVLQVYGLPRDIKGVTIHWWNDPKFNPTYHATCSYLSRANGNTSAHFVVQGSKVACLVSPENAAWHAGSAQGNAQTIGIEMSPWATMEDMATLASLIRFLEQAYGKSLMIYRHQDWSATACPGTYATRIEELVRLVNAGPSGATSSPAAAPRPDGMIYPVTGFPVTQKFNAGHDLATNVGGGHTGVDWATPVGTPLKAVADGVVLWSDWASKLPRTSWEARWFLVGGGFGGLSTDSGITLVIDHGGYLSIGAHLNETQLNIGDKVKQGDIVGKTGDTGYVTGAHLHFEILPKPFAWSNGFYGRTDPQIFIQARQAIATVTSKDWQEMFSEKQLEDIVYRGARNAMRDIIEAPFRRQGPESAKTWPNENQTSSFGAVLRWTDESWITSVKNDKAISDAVKAVGEAVAGLGKRLDAIEAKSTHAPVTAAGVDTNALQQMISAAVRTELNKTTLRSN